tara:strand:- start:963 stop:1286 length:324 start_codon:yes stop_codon:yes gene_type:complete
MKAKHWELHSLATLRNTAKRQLQKEWQSIEGNVNPHNFPHPPIAEQDAKVEAMGLSMKVCLGEVTVLSYGFEGSQDDMYAVAIIQDADGWLSTTSVDSLQVVSDAEL